MIDFSNCEFSDKDFEGGSLSNVSVIYNNKDYLIKIHDTVSKAQKLSKYEENYYRNNVICEHIACDFIKDCIGFPVQNTLLGKYFYKKEGKYKEIIACEDFREANMDLVHYNRFLRDYVVVIRGNNNAKSMRSFTIDEIIDSIIFTEKTRPHLKQFNIRKYFWTLFIIDTLIGNYDRHAKNWGLLRNKITDKPIGFSPILLY